MSQPVSQIDYEAMQRSADGFATAGEVLDMVSKALLAAIMLLKTTAFIGLVGGYAVQAYLENIQPIVDRLSQKCLEISGDLVDVIRAKQADDQQMSGNFGP